ncbi:YpmS family protein [Barrientosiimonas marina]|uniref:YpmS family protein n=1 Tax=Lentibacillus kimchii TaxID=1542911 RepID=A0ABW2UXD9_9BACI
MSKQKVHKWRRWFFLLLGVNVLALACIAILIFWPVSETEEPDPADHHTQLRSEFVVRTTKQNLDQLINAYLEKLLKGDGHQYHVSLDKDVELAGELPVFSTTVPLSVHLEPIVQKNGDITLKQKSISIGKLALPNKKIMEYLEKYLPMPEWVTVNPAEEEIYVAVTDMDIKSNFHISVKQIDLEADNIAFNIEVPYRSLGIKQAAYNAQ